MNNHDTRPAGATVQSAVSCPDCGEGFKVEADLAGKKVKCPQCGCGVYVPKERSQSAGGGPKRRWLFPALGIALVLVAAAVGCAIVAFLTIPRRPPEIPDVYVSKLTLLADKVRTQESIKLDARDMREKGIVIGDKDLAVLDGLAGLRDLNLDRTSITNAGLKQVGQLHGLQVLSLTETPVTDAGLAELKGLTGLRDLRLDTVGISDAGLAHLKAMPQLRKLSLYQTPVSDAGLVHLQALSFLEHLSLDRTAVTDAGLKHLNGMTNLRYLSVWETRVTDAGVEELLRALPKLRINR